MDEIETEGIYSRIKALDEDQQYLFWFSIFNAFVIILAILVVCFK